MAQGRKTGGRQKGTQNKATAAKQAVLDAAFTAAAALIPPEMIDRLTPAEYLDAVWKAFAKLGETKAAIPIAIEAAPYFNAKKVAKPEDPAAGNDAPQGFVDGPPIAGSMDEWAQRAKTRTPSTPPDLQLSQESSQASSVDREEEASPTQAPGSSETPSENG